MGNTNFSGVTVNGAQLLPGAGFIPPFNGNYFYVNETTGSDGNPGTSDAPLASLAQAQVLATSGNNDVVFFTGTVHQTATLAWAKNNVHLVGLCAPIKRGKRARISVSGATPFEPLVSVTGNGCMFANFATFYAFSTTATNNTICWQDTGGRSCYNLVEFMGFGDATVSTGTANVTGARAMVFNTNTGESTWRDCVFGVDTVQRGAVNYTLEIAGAAPRLHFYGCDFESDIASGGTAGSHVLIGALGIDRYCKFTNCVFMDATSSGASAMAQVFNVNASPGGFILLNGSQIKGPTAWQGTPNGTIFLDMPVVSQSGGGYMLVNT